MNTEMNRFFSPQNQNGAALFVSLIMLLVLTIVGLSASQRSNLQQQMAGNMHVTDFAFNAAQGAVGGTIAEMNSVSVRDPANILAQFRFQQQNIPSAPFCFDEDGKVGTCGTSWLDSQSKLEARATVTVVGQCNPSACGGVSMDMGNAGQMGCRVFKIDGDGTVGGVAGTAQAQSSSVSLWTYEMTPCN